MSEITTHQIRPYARLLTMLGEQLIKNDRIALVELIKNCYDADATKVRISFEDFGPGLLVTPSSRIIVEDNGDGMSFDTVTRHWLNPATNVKEARKQEGRATTAAGRIIQGEKGIGRFAMFKLGSRVQLTTRARSSDEEVSVQIDIGLLDTVPELEDGVVQPAPFLDELSAELSRSAPSVFDGSSEFGSHGTRLTISVLRGRWSRGTLESLHEDVLRLRPLRSSRMSQRDSPANEFEVSYLVNGETPTDLENPEPVLESLRDRAVLRVDGEFEQASNSFVLRVNGENRSISLSAGEILGLDLYARLVDKERKPYAFSCGDFSFDFLVFDVRGNADVRFKLNPVEKALIKNHRIYLYRDGVRVLPYGDPDDDWLQLDTIRGTVGANRVLSNDQTVGFVYISQEENRELRDKTNREGLIDSGQAYADFIRLLQLLINYLRKGDFARHLASERQEQDAKDQQELDSVDIRLNELQAAVKDTPRASAAFDSFARAYQVDRKVIYDRLERTEDLAGVGLSVETASHDVIASANQAFKESTVLVEQLGFELGKDHDISRRAGRLSASLSFIVSRLQDVQGLFVSSRSSSKGLNLVQYVRRIESIYSRALKDSGIEVVYQGDLELEFNTHTATLLQIFLNLVDNAVYWMRVSEVDNPVITVTVDARARTLEFTDNGPGISAKDLPYIFDPFFSGRGDEDAALASTSRAKLPGAIGLNSSSLVKPVTVM